MSDNTDDFRESLASYKKALQQEYDAIEAGDTDQVLAVVKKNIAKAAIQLSDELVSLAKNAESESTKLGSIKFAFEFLFGKEAAKEGSFDDLMKKLTSVDDEA